jgi:hypothetical protein
MLSRTVWAGLAALVAFSITAALMVHLIGEPRRSVDLFLAGSFGTFAALIALFIALMKPSDWSKLFYKTRRVRPKPSRSGKTLGL